MPIYRKRYASFTRRKLGMRGKKRGYGNMRIRYKRTGYKRNKSTPYGWKNDGKELKYHKPLNVTDGKQLVLEKATPDINDISSDGFVAWNLNGIPQGSDVTQREGRQVLMKYVELNICISPDEGFQHGSTQNLMKEDVRMLVVLDTANNNQLSQTGLPLSTILDSGDQKDDRTSINQHTNLNFRQRFQILADKTWSFGWGAPTGGAGLQAINIKEKIQLNTIVNYSGTGFSIGNIADKAVWLYFYARNQNYMTTQGITNYGRIIQVDSRLRFTE